MQLQVQDGWRQLQREKEELQQKVGDLQGCLKKLQGERTEAERKLARLGKERSALRKALEKVMTSSHSFYSNSTIIMSTRQRRREPCPFIYPLLIKLLLLLLLWFSRVFCKKKDADYKQLFFDVFFLHEADWQPEATFYLISAHSWGPLTCCCHKYSSLKVLTHRANSLGE